MTDKVTLTNLANLQNETTAVNAINANNAAITTAMDNTLSRDGTSPNQMGANFDMNSNHILNLPTPATASEPLRLQDLSSFTGGGTVTNIPAGGTNGQLLAKSSSVDYAVHWIDESSDLTAGTNIALTGTTPTTISTTANPTFATSTTTPIIAGGTAAGSTLSIKSTSNGSPSGDSTTIQGSTVTLRAATGATGVVNVGVANTTSGSLVIAGAASGSTTLQPASAASGTLTLPAATDTLIGKATTDTLTNKTYDTAGAGNSFSINGVAATANTGTGAVVRATSPTLVTPTIGAATATTINGITISASTGTLALNTNQLAVTGVGQVLALAGPTGTMTFQGTDTYVGRATTDTLTNKTFDTAGTGNVFKVNGTTVTTASNILDTISSTQGTILYRNASNWVALAPGTSGQFLQTLGAAANPVWQTGSGATTSGNRTLLNTLTASSSATLADTTSFTSTFRNYEIVFSNILPATNTTSCRLRVNVGGVQTTSYLGAANSSAGNNETSTTQYQVSRGTADVSNAGSGISGVITLYNAADTTAPKMLNGVTSYPNSGGGAAVITATGWYTGSNAAVTGIQVDFSSGNIASGQIKIYGIVN